MSETETMTAPGEGGGPAAAVRVEPLVPGAEAAAEWDAFVAAHPDGSHYQRAGWARVVRDAFGQSPLWLAARSESGIEGVLPLVAFSNPIFGKYLVSVPYMNRGGVLASTDRARNALLDEARRQLEARGAAFCELRHVAGIDPNLPARETKVSMSLDVAKEEEVLWKEIGPKVRNLVRKAEKSGLTVREGDPATDLDGFYDVFALNMRDLGTPVYSPSFFREVFREFPDDVRLTVVEDGETVAAAGICITWREFTEIHWAASRREYLKRSPNMLLYWEAISHAARTGLREFCFGRSTEGSGPYRFKKQWGASPTPLRWEYLLPEGGEMPGLNPDNPKYRLAVSMWKKLPLPVTRILGPPIVRHLP